MALRRHVASSGSVDFPTSGAQAPPVAVSAQEAITGVWIRNDDTPEQVYDKVTQIFPAEWTVRFYKLVAKGDVT